MVLGRELSFVINSILKKFLNVFVRSVREAVFFIWTIIDISGPAYRVIVPAVIYLAALRVIHGPDLASHPMRHTIAALRRIHGYRKVKYGDVIFVHRRNYGFPYDHYGIYSGENRVIHYTKSCDDGPCIAETSLARFIEDEKYYSIRYFPETEDELKVLLRYINKQKSKCSLLDIQHIEEYEFYSPAETV